MTARADGSPRGTVRDGARPGERPAAIRASARSAARAPTGSIADGDAPGCCAAIRTRSAPGRMRKRHGGGEHGGLAVDARRDRLGRSTRNSGVDHCRHGRRRRLPRVPGGSTTVMPAAPWSTAGRVPAPAAPAEAVLVVADEDDRRAAAASVRPGVVQVSSLASPPGAEGVGHRLEQRRGSWPAGTRSAGPPRRRRPATRC